MKLRSCPNGACCKYSSAAFTLIECLLYMGLFLFLLMFAFSAYFRVQDTSEALRRNAGEIESVLQVGETWRSDIRKATGPIIADGEEIRIPVGDGQMIYRFERGTVARRNPHNERWQPLLPNVKSSQMIEDAGSHVSAWRWEIELKAREPKPHVRPLFTFEAVPEVQVK